MKGKIIYTYNDWHLGDCVFTIIILNQTKRYLEDNNVHIYFYCNKSYINQLNEFIQTKHIQLHNYQIPIGIPNWIGEKHKQINYYNKGNQKYNDFYVLYANQLYNEMNIPCVINTFEYEDNDLLIRYDNLNDKYKNLDYLIINSQPLSGQYNYNKNEWDDLIITNLSKYKIVTTLKVDNIICTLDDNLSIKDIAAISTHAKKIIAINTGPLVGCFNKYTLTNVEKVYVLDINNEYSYDKFINIKKIS